MEMIDKIEKQKQQPAVQQAIKPVSKPDPKSDKQL